MELCFERCIIFMKILVLILLVGIVTSPSASCHYSCTTDQCSAPQDASMCTDCLTDRTKTGGYCLCNDGKFDDGVNQACAACSITCGKCTSTNTCTACGSSTFRTLNTTYNTCPCDAGYYENNVPICATCHYTCATCNGALETNCQSCNNVDHFRTLNNLGKCACDDGYFTVNNVKQCSKCHHSCKTCLDGTTCGSCDVLLYRKDALNVLTQCDC